MSPFFLSTSLLTLYSSQLTYRRLQCRHSLLHHTPLVWTGILPRDSSHTLPTKGLLGTEGWLICRIHHCLLEQKFLSPHALADRNPPYLSGLGTGTELTKLSTQWLDWQKRILVNEEAYSPALKTRNKWSFGVCGLPPVVVTRLGRLLSGPTTTKW